MAQDEDKLMVPGEGGGIDKAGGGDVAKPQDGEVAKPQDGQDKDGDDNGDKDIKKTNYSSGNPGVVGLGVYLVLFTLFAFYGLNVLMRAESPETTVIDNNTEEISCGNDKHVITKGAAAASDTNNTQNKSANGNTKEDASPTNTNTNTNSNTNTNTNTTNASAANGNTGNTRGNRNTNSNQAGGNQAGNDNKNKTTPSPKPIKAEVPEVTVPAFLCVKGRFIEERMVPADGYLFFVVLFAGMLGGLMRGIGSFARHLGQGDFSFQWSWFYILLPFTGAIISLAIYLVLRGGFYGGGVGKGLVLNVFAFAALAILTGLFSENAQEKLRQVANTLLTEVPKKVEKKSN